MSRKKAQQEWRNVLIPIILTIIFVILAYSFLFTESGVRVVRGWNAKVMSTIGAPIRLPSFGKLEAEKIGLSAGIHSDPPYSEMLCSGESILLGAGATQLPEGMAWKDVVCNWDFDVSEDAPGWAADGIDNDRDGQVDEEDEAGQAKWAGDGVLDNDKDSKECFNIEKTFNRAATDIKLTIITKEGVEDSQIVRIKKADFCLDSFKNSQTAISNGSTIYLQVPSHLRLAGSRVTFQSESYIDHIALDIGGQSWSSGYLYVQSGQLIGFHSYINSWLESSCPAVQGVLCDVPITWEIVPAQAGVATAKIVITKIAFPEEQIKL